MGHSTLSHEISIFEPSQNIHEMDRYSLQSPEQLRKNSFASFLSVESLRLYF